MMMMKRRRIQQYGNLVSPSEDTDPNTVASIYSLPALESTLQFETGADSTLEAGKVVDIPTSASLLGIRLFQYNRFFWERNFFPFTHSNCLVGLFLLIWNPITERYWSAILPIVIPRTPMCLTNNEAKEQNVQTLIQEFLYGLNLQFSQARRILAKNSDTSDAASIIDETTVQFPFIQTTFPNLPPLEWSFLNNSFQLSLHVSYQPNAVIPPTNPFLYQLISIDDSMLPSINSAQFTFPGVATGTDRGWMGQGPYASGFGQYYDSIFDRYYDGYTDDERNILWGFTFSPLTQPAGLPMSSSAFYTLWKNLRLMNSQGAQTITSGLNCGLISTRFFSVQSNVITRNQRRPVMSNNKWFGNNNTVSIVYSSARQGICSLQDATKAGTISDVSLSHNPYFHFRPFEAKQNLDLKLVDEWGNVLQSYASIAGPLDSTFPIVPGEIATNYQQLSSIIYTFWDDYRNRQYDDGTNPGAPPLPQLLIPPQYNTAYNPLATQNPDGTPLQPYVALQNTYILFGFPNFPSPCMPFTTPTSENVQSFPSTGLVHFGRVLSDY